MAEEALVTLAFLLSVVLLVSLGRVVGWQDALRSRRAFRRYRAVERRSRR